MKINFIIAVLFLFIITSCSEDDSPFTNPNVIAEDENIISLEELVLSLKLKTSDTSYVVVESVDSVKILINSRFWNSVSSEKIDTTKINSFIVSNQLYTKDPLEYLILAKRELDELDFETAGDYANYLNQFFALEPGDYACTIESFQVEFNNGTIKTYYPFEIQFFTVGQNKKSVYIGEFELNI